MYIRHRFTAMCIASAMLISSVTADELDPSKVNRNDYGPLTAYGETPAESANKKVMFDWVRMNMIDRKPKEAFEKYVSTEYCNHGHMSAGTRDCANYSETLTRWVGNYGKPLAPGATLEIPIMAAVNGEMVTMYGRGVDIFRVRDGKVTDHWDASPPARITLKAHGAAFTQWMKDGRKGAPPAEKDGPSRPITVSEELLTSVSYGPMTPYGETVAEQKAKRTVFLWNHMTMIQGKGRAAAEKYLSEDFCDHSHMMTGGAKPCATRAELMASTMMSRPAAKIGDRVEMPSMASVNGEMVTMYGAGVDIFRVRDGKITDHWDASPGTAIVIPEHGFDQPDTSTRRLNGETIAGGMGPGGGGAPPAVAPPAR
jgi:predicted SnoaL-like aldol condensation-catalyzing enzyme